MVQSLTLTSVVSCGVVKQGHGKRGPFQTMANRRRAIPRVPISRGQRSRSRMSLQVGKIVFCVCDALPLSRANRTPTMQPIFNSVCNRVLCCINFLQQF